MKPTKNRVFCLIINRPKMLFETEKEANGFIKFNEDTVRNSGKKKFKKLRAYHCISCGGWHITSIQLTKKQIKEKDDRINRIIDNKKKEKELKLAVSSEERAFEYIKKFDLLSFGSKKKARKYFSENRANFPKGLDECLVFRVLKQLPIEYFTTIDIRRENLSKDEIKKEVDKLYNRLPFEKLTDRSLLLKYIDWEFQYKEKVKPIIIIELKKKLNLL